MVRRSTGDQVRARERWSAAAEVGQGFGGISFHGGLERSFKRIELRGGGRYTVKKWNPTGGIGFNLSPGVAIDVAAFGTNGTLVISASAGGYASS